MCFSEFCEGRTVEENWRFCTALDRTTVLLLSFFENWREMSCELDRPGQEVTLLYLKVESEPWSSRIVTTVVVVKFILIRINIYFLNWCDFDSRH